VSQVELLLLGVNHRTAPVALRERLSFTPEEAAKTLRELCASPAVKEGMILSTCNRTEMYVLSPEAAAGEAQVRAQLREAKGADLLAPGDHRYLLKQREAARQLLRVATGLDSMVLGEMQILGQVKAAFAMAQQAGAAGLLLERLLAAAVHAGKRARAETEIGAGSVSVASAAVSLATKVFGELTARRVLVVGAGETGCLAARHFAELRPAALLIANRGLERAQAVAEELAAQALPLTALSEALPRVDVVLCATRSAGLIITDTMVRAAMAERPSRPLLLVDLAIPRDIEEAAGRRDNVFLYPIDALRTIVDRNLARRQGEVPRVEAIIEEECDRFFAWLNGLGVAPLVRELRELFERVRAEEVGKSLRHFSAEDQERVDRLTRSLVNKLLHRPTTQLKAIDLGSELGLDRLDTVRDLFGLGQGIGDETDTEAGRGE
jgi:glutamyl-tRNA reductase